jgi:hypothetical protein
MSKNLFKKTMMFTDIHFGLKSNSDMHNQDCLDFIKWAVNTAKEEDCETCFFLGDYHNNRAAMNLRTMNYAVQGLELLSSNFENTYFIPGNHDLFYKDRRDIQSVEWAKHLPNINIVNDFFNEGGVAIVPWLVKDEHKRIGKIKADYCMGHFELPHFYMNAKIAMPDHGELQKEHFGQFNGVFSGHFHMRQNNSNITYIGNCFPHNYADAGDDSRGCAILEWGKPVEYRSWSDQPTYRVFKLSEVLNNAEALLKPKMHVRINIDIDISYEEANFIKETFVETYQLREISLIPQKEDFGNLDVDSSSLSFESIDSIVAKQINQINSDHYDNNLLLSIYNNL